MPEDVPTATTWCINKLIKAMGEAKMLAIKLLSVKHQEKLRHLYALKTWVSTLLL